MKSSSRIEKNGRVAFTLIEMLVMISLLLVLMAFLSPGLKSARDSAKSIQCINTLRQFHLAVLQYCQDNEEWLPPRYDSDGYWWPQTLVRHNYIKTKMHYGFYTLSNPNCNGIFACSSEKGVSAYDGTMTGWHGSHYGFNIYLNSTSAPGAKLCKLIDMQQVHSKYVLIGDCSGSLRLGLSIASGTGAFRHHAKMNVVFMDGHCDSIEPSEMLDSSNTIWLP
ncbi:MAG: type II secretion system protein [Verrucomicrobiae bacterium]|nr:type II secretion system protein [Verrucomicrobiae bacterium]